MHERHEPGEDEEDDRGRDVEDPDPLVVRRDEPARHPPPLPGGYRFSPSCHSAGSPSGRWRALRPARPSSPRRPRASLRARPLRTRFSSACGFGERRRSGDARADAALAGEAVALGAHAFPLLLAELGRPCVCVVALLVEPRVERRLRHDLDGREHPRVLEAAQLCALARCRRLRLSASNHVSFVRPGIASILPPSAGIHHEWMTSESGAFTTSFTGRRRARASGRSR